MKKYKPLPYFQWHYFHSWSKEKPNIARFEVVDVHPREATYATVVDVIFYHDGIKHKMTLPLWKHDSNNPDLLEEWQKNLHDKKIKKKKEFIMKTWLSYSKTGNTIRRFILEF
jgi:hypothetical protein